MKHILRAAAFIACAGFGTTMYAQNNGQSAPPSEQRGRGGEDAKVTVTGCLAKGTASGEYIVTDQKSGEKVPFAGPAQLDKYVNQTVRLTGRMETNGGDKVFRPEAISQISASCEKAQ